VPQIGERKVSILADRRQIQERLRSVAEDVFGVIEHEREILKKPAGVRGIRETVQIRWMMTSNLCVWAKDEGTDQW
jgi:hypothetical protein